jgi:hypothetical protein
LHALLLTAYLIPSPPLPISYRTGHIVTAVQLTVHSQVTTQSVTVG